MNDSSHVSSVCSKNASVQNTVHSYAGRRNAQSVVSSRVLCKKKCTFSAFTSLNGKHKHSSLERIIKMRAYCDLQGFTKLIPSKKKKNHGFYGKRRLSTKFGHFPKEKLKPMFFIFQFDKQKIERFVFSSQLEKFGFHENRSFSSVL